MEFVRLFSNKRFLMMIAGLLLINGLFYIKAQQDTVLYDNVSVREISQQRNEFIQEYSSLGMQDAYAKNMERIDECQILGQLSTYHASKVQSPEEYDELYAKSDTALRKEHPDLAGVFDSNPERTTEEYFYITMKVLSDIRKQQEYIIGYGSSIEKIEEQAIRDGTIRIFRDNTPFTQNNIDKTVRDFQRIRNVPLEIGNDDVLKSILFYKTTQVLILIFILFLLLGFLNERKTGLWKIVYSSKNGRKTLALRRCGILLLSLAGMNILMYASLLLLSVSLYGKPDDLFRMVQSIEMFRGFTIPMTVLEFMGGLLAANIIAGFAVAIFLWLVLSAFELLNLGIAVSGLFLGGEWLLYHFLPVQSNFNSLKYINLLCYIHISQELPGYRNIRFFALAIGRPVFILGSALILAFCMIAACLFVNEKKKPFQTFRWTGTCCSGWRRKMSETFFRWIESFHVTLLELYKVLFVHKGILVLVALCCLLYGGIKKDTMYYSPSDYIVNSFYEAYGGLPTEDALASIEGLTVEIAAAEKEYADAYEKYRNNKISYDEWMGSNYKQSTYEDKKKALLKINEKVLYLQTLAAEKQIDGWFVNPKAYDQLLGEKGVAARIRYALEAVFCLILLLSNLFAYEYHNNIKKILHSTFYGRKPLFIRKMACAGILTIVVWLLVYGTEIAAVARTYGIPCLGAPIQSLPLMKDCSLPCSIGAFLFLIYGIRLLQLLAIAFITCYLSARVPQSICLSIASVLFLVPALLALLGVDFFKNISVIQSIAGMKDIFNSSSPGGGILPLVVLLVLGITGFWMSKIRWCKTT